MRLGYFLPQMGPAAGPDAMTAVARRAEEIGWDSLWVTERLLLPLSAAGALPVARTASLPDVYRTVVDPLSALTFVAGQTSRIAVGTSVLNIPWYNATLLARQLTAIDVLSKGRLRVGFGTGWSPDEYEAVGVPWKERGRRADENLAALEGHLDPRPGRVRGGALPDRALGHRPEAGADAAPADLHGRLHAGGDGPRRALRRRLDAGRRPARGDRGPCSPRSGRWRRTPAATPRRSS